MENEATQPGAENSQTEAPQGNDDAALLSAYLAQQEESEPVDDAPAGQPATQADEQSQQAADTFTVKIDGVEKNVTRDELIAHYQKGESSNKRFEEAAQIRREAEAQRTAFQQQQQVLANAVQHFNQVAQRYNVAPPSLDLLENNPHEYLRQKEQYEQFQGEMQKAQAAQAYLQQQQAQQQQQYLQQHLAVESQKLIDLLPDWKDQTVRTRDEQDLIKYLSDKGYSQEDIVGLNTSRATNIQLAINAMKYERLMQQAKSANKRVEQLPPRVERPGVANVQSGKRDAYQRLTRSGSIDDAAAAFSELFS